ncbi:MAG TPA: polysaccharide pyruvyl transferase family protein [Propionibacteriaceae bacterium]|nr:polysaccharide pyruvyl transferase family protein [Propionibacteriaceae bacterium]
MARILLRAHKNPLRAASVEDSLEQNLLGSNAGNLVFSQAVYRLLSIDGNELDTSGLLRKKPSQINADYDRVVIPLANAFRASYLKTLESLADLIEQLTIPVTVIGVGAQASIGGEISRAGDVDAATTRFTRAVLNRSPSIGVRGEFTKDYLQGLGFGDEHVRVIGCPSMFMYGPDLTIQKRVESLGPQSRIALNISPYVKEMGPISLDHAARYPNLVYMAQNRETLALMLHGHYPYPEKKLESLRASGVPVYLDHPLIEEDRVRFFVDPRTWFDHLAGYDFSFGTRIHGNIAALLAGTPALVLAHDSRTVELAQYHHIPYRTVQSLGGDADAAKLYAAAEWDSLNQGHPANWRIFASYLGDHGLTHVYDEGQSAERFDSALRAAPLPPPVGTLMGASPQELYDMKARTSTLSAELRAARKKLKAGPTVAPGPVSTVIRRVRNRIRRLR